MAKSIKNLNWATFQAFALIPLSGLAMDIFIPSLPSMATDLSITENLVRQTISVFLISYGLSQLFVGTIVDAYGRYRASYWSLITFIAMCGLTYFSHSISVILIARIMQGITVGIITVAKRAFIVDNYEGEKRKKLLGYITIIWSLGPIIAPFLGGYIAYHFGWRFHFVFLGLYALIILFLEFIFSGESIKIYSSLAFRSVVSKFRIMLSDKSFVTGLMILSTCTSIVMIYNLSGAFIIEQMGYSSVVIGYVSLSLGCAWLLGGLASNYFINKPLTLKIRWATALQIMIILISFGISIQYTSLALLVISAFSIHLLSGFIFTTYFIFCLSKFPNFAGISGGFIGGMAYMGTAVLSYLIVGVIQPESLTLLAISYLIASVLQILIILISFRFIKK